MTKYQTNTVSYCVNSKGIKIPPYKNNYKREKKSIFSGNKNFSDVICEGIIFVIGTGAALLIAAAIIIIFTNLIY
tara:strand:+ start:731 stop:955 length:225 start_codon:yes stop_codon:yes gene_type:complete